MTKDLYQLEKLRQGKNPSQKVLQSTKVEESLTCSILKLCREAFCRRINDLFI